MKRLPIQSCIALSGLLRLDTRKWIASRVYRQVYGDRVDFSVTDGRISITAALEAASNRLMTVDQDEIE